MYRNRTETTAPELVYGQEFFAEFEPVSVGDQLRRVPGVAFTSDIGESDAPQMRGLGQGFTQVLVNGRPIPGAGNDRTVFVDRIPAEIVDRIEVIRSPSADIDSQRSEERTSELQSLMRISYAVFCLRQKTCTH